MDLLLQRTAEHVAVDTACGGLQAVNPSHNSCIHISEQHTQREMIYRSCLQHGGCAWCASSLSLCRCSLPRSHCTAEPGSCRDSSHRLPSLLTWGTSHWWGPQVVYHQWGLEWLAVLSRSAPRLTVTPCWGGGLLIRPKGARGGEGTYRMWMLLAHLQRWWMNRL